MLSTLQVVWFPDPSSPLPKGEEGSGNQTTLLAEAASLSSDPATSLVVLWERDNVYFTPRPI